MYVCGTVRYFACMARSELLLVRLSAGPSSVSTWTSADRKVREREAKHLAQSSAHEVERAGVVTSRAS